MNKLSLLLFIFLFLIGAGITSNNLFAQDMSGWSDDDDDDDGWADDDDDDTVEESAEMRAYKKAKTGTIEDCEKFLKGFTNSKYFKEIEARLDELKAKEDDGEEENLTAAEIERRRKEEALGLTDKKETTEDLTDDGSTGQIGTALTKQEIEHLWNGSSPWTVKMIPHAHFSLVLSKTDWKGEITDGSGSNIVLNAGAEYEISDMVNMPVSVFGDLGLRLMNKNPWDSDGFAVTTWLGAKYLVMDQTSERNQGLILAAALSVGVGIGPGDHEKNFSIWTGHMNPPVFLVTPMITGIATYQINRNAFINGTLGFMFFIGTDDDSETYPEDQASMFAVEASAEYFTTFELLMKKFGVHSGFTFRSSYDPLFSIYGKINSLLGPYMQLVIPFTSETSSVSMMFVVGYNLPLYEFEQPADEIEEPIKEDTPVQPSDEPNPEDPGWEE